MRYIMAKKITTVSGNTVREFLISNPVEGVEVKDTRGRLSNKAVEAFHAANPSLRYVAGTKDEKTVTLTVTKPLANGKSRKTKVEVPVAKARALAGEAAGERGILSSKALLAASEAYAKA